MLIASPILVVSIRYLMDFCSVQRFDLNYKGRNCLVRTRLTRLGDKAARGKVLNSERA